MEEAASPLADTSATPNASADTTATATHPDSGVYVDEDEPSFWLWAIDDEAHKDFKDWQGHGVLGVEGGGELPNEEECTWPGDLRPYEDDEYIDPYYLHLGSEEGEAGHGRLRALYYLEEREDGCVRLAAKGPIKDRSVLPSTFPRITFPGSHLGPETGVGLYCSQYTQRQHKDRVLVHVRYMHGDRLRMERLKDVLLPETVELHGLRAILANSLMPEHPFEAHYISSCSIYKETSRRTISELPTHGRHYFQEGDILILWRKVSLYERWQIHRSLPALPVVQYFESFESGRHCGTTAARTETIVKWGGDQTHAHTIRGDAIFYFPETNETVTASANTLCGHSEYFRSLLRSGFAESRIVSLGEVIRTQIGERLARREEDVDESQHLSRKQDLAKGIPSFDVLCVIVRDSSANAYRTAIQFLDLYEREKDDIPVKLPGASEAAELFAMAAMTGLRHLRRHALREYTMRLSCADIVEEIVRRSQDAHDDLLAACVRAVAVNYGTVRSLPAFAEMLDKWKRDELDANSAAIMKEIMEEAASAPHKTTWTFGEASGQR